MTIKTRMVTSIADFVGALSEDQSDCEGVRWYRGQSDSSWPLLPGYTRLDSAPPETSLFNEFRKSAAMLAEVVPIESFDWLMLMQHYGVPTRLLDWTENPMIALYFALSDRERHVDKDATFWLLKPTLLNSNAGIEDRNDVNYIPSFQDEEPKPYTIEYLRNSPKTSLSPIAVIAMRNNARIQAQSGVFTIHHVKETPIEGVGDGTHVIKYIIPASEKDTLAKQLETLGLNRFHVFPELATIGEIIRGRHT